MESLRSRAAYKRQREVLPYQWKPINFQRNEFRILQLLRISHCAGEQVVEASVQNVPMNGHPSYDALSYSWGNRERSKTILLDGIPHPITENLHQALLVLIDNGVQRLWVDAICIDQNNLDEKAAQVRRMATIFQEADKVIAWLGPTTSVSDQILSLLKRVDISSLGDCFWARSLLIPYPESRNLHVDAKLLEFLNCEYWCKLWIVQEIAVASEVRVFWGNDSLDGVVLEHLFSQVLWDRVRAEAGNSWDTISKESFEHTVNIWSIRHLLRNRQPMDLLSLLLQLRQGETTQLLDRVYAIIGLAYDQGALIAEPDYTLKPDQLCFLATRRFIRTTNSLDIILFNAFSDSPMYRDDWLTWVCPLFHFNDFFGWYEAEVSSLIDYVYGRRLKLRCGSVGKFWNATNSSIITKGTAKMEPKSLSVVGFRLGDIKSSRMSKQDIASFWKQRSDSQLLETLDSLGRMLMIYSHLYDRNLVRRMIVRLLENLIFQEPENEYLSEAWYPYLLNFDQNGEGSLAVGTHQRAQVQELFTRMRAKVDAEGILNPSAEDMQHATEAVLEIIAEFPRLFLFESECFGMATGHLMPPKGELWLLTGCSMPVVLRPVEPGMDSVRPSYEIRSYVVLDSVNIHGKRCRVMDGEAWRNANEEDFQWIDIGPNDQERIARRLHVSKSLAKRA